MNATIQIERVGHRGQGVGYDSKGNIYFVVGTIPGDRVQVSFEEGKRYRDARLISIEKPSENRRASPCAYFGECGGCDWLNTEYGFQLRTKEQILNHVLERSGLLPSRKLPMIGASVIFGYRGRVQLKFGGGRLGFMKRHSHELVDIENCYVARPELNAAILKLRKDKPLLLRRGRVELMSSEQGEVKVIYDSPQGGLGFAQVHREQNEKLRKIVAESVRKLSSKKVVELYCGDGNLTIAYSPLASGVIAVDRNSFGICEAERVRVEKGLSHVRFLLGVVGSRLLKILPAEIRDQYDTLILDPPRCGVGENLSLFLHKNLKSVLYVSCDPLSFSQDARRIVKAGFVFDEIQPIDMFPQTRHIELVSIFLRS